MKPRSGTPLQRALRSLLLAGGVLLALVTYAYGFQVTKVNLEETRSEQRQTQLVRILRLLARPNILQFPQEDVTITARFFMPCPATPLEQREVDPTQAYILVTPGCVERGGRIQVEGFNLEPNAEADVFFVPPSQLNLRLATTRTDSGGHFRIEAQLPERSSEEAQSISARTTQSVGTPRFSQNAIDTWDKIVETVFLALLATTLGTLLAVPLSFFAARNLMKGITISTLGLSLAVLAAPVGIVLGTGFAPRVAAWASSVAQSEWVSVAGAVIAPALAWLLARWALPPVETERAALAVRVARAVAVVAAALSALVGLTYLSETLVYFGASLAAALPGLGFLGTFLENLGDILELLLSGATGLIVAGVLVNAGGRATRILDARVRPQTREWIEWLASAAAGATLFVLIAAGVDWLYQIGDPRIILYIPAFAGALAGLALTFRYRGGDKVPIGFAIYTLARTVFNGLRAIEALIMVIVFIVWVGIGPFAGVLALSLHSIAAMAKLYSEQVESILPGPLEAITATGATRLQTILYAVVPQIIPPYISFTMYRWDINVRMSTIIGFAGGGGIGFLLSQNINLLRYREASAQILAIAIVVAAMDYLSSALRERVI
ncbi:MAG: ABC transporter permease subunit [Anaerolineales bacterium]